MNLPSILIGAFLILCLFFALRGWLRGRKKGGCCGECDRCSGCSHKEP